MSDIFLEGAVSDPDNFTIGSILREARAKMSGVKLVIVGGVIVTSIIQVYIDRIVMATLAGMGLIMGQDYSVIWFITYFLSSTLVAMLTCVFWVGLDMMGVRRAANQPVYFRDIFSYFGKLLPLAITALLTSIMVSIGFVLFVLPGIYLAIAYAFATLLVVERGLSPWEAMETSRKAIHQCWFRVFGLSVVLSLIIIISAIPMLIGLIWSLPLTFIAMGILYRNLFGVQAISDLEQM